MTDEVIVAKAQELYAADDVVIYNDAYVDLTEDGAWVDAHVWVPIEREEKVAK